MAWEIPAAVVGLMMIVHVLYFEKRYAASWRFFGSVDAKTSVNNSALAGALLKKGLVRDGLYANRVAVVVDGICMVGILSFMDSVSVLFACSIIPTYLFFRCFVDTV